MISACMWLFVGALLGAVAGAWPREQEPGILSEIVLGAAGAVAAGWLLGLLGLRFDGTVVGPLASLLGAAAGALLVLIAVRRREAAPRDADKG